MKEAEPIWDAPLAERLGAADALLLVSRLLEVVTVDQLLAELDRLEVGPLGVVVVGSPIEDAVYDGKPPSQREPAESSAASPAHGHGPSRGSFNDRMSDEPPRRHTTDRAGRRRRLSLMAGLAVAVVSVGLGSDGEPSLAGGDRRGGTSPRSRRRRRPPAGR